MRALAPAFHPGVEEKERQAAEVVAMQVGEQKGVDGVGINALAVHGNQRRWPAVHEVTDGAVVHQDAGLEPAAAAKGVAGPQETHSRRHGQSPRRCRKGFEPIPKQTLPGIILLITLKGANVSRRHGEGHGEEGAEMDKIEFGDSFLTGHPAIDSAHGRIIEIINEILGAIDGERYDLCRELFGAFLSIAREHFSEEEEILRKAGFPGLEYHAHYHSKLLGQAEAVREMCDGLTDKRPLRLCFEELVGFLIDDIIAGDMEFKSYLAACGLTK